MSAPILSVVINTIGSEYLRKIVDIYLASPVPIQIVIVFDNPNADPAGFLDEVQINNELVIIERNEKNLGIAKTTNIGISLAKGDIILRNDDDDIPELARAEKTAAFFYENQDIDIIYTFAKGVEVDADSSWIIEGPTNNEEIQEKLLKRNFIVHSSIAFRRKAFSKINFYDETFRYALDYDFYLRAMRAGLKFGCIPEMLITRLYHSNSITVSKRKRQILHSMAARLLHDAQVEEEVCPWPVIARYLLLLAIPNSLRKLRRKIGRGR